MLTIIIGASGSGKSLFAKEYAKQVYEEKVEQGIEGSLFYIATMLPYGIETQKKIERHKIQREGKPFYVIEQYKDIEKSLACIRERKRIEEKKESTVLLDCLSNLVANELYDEERQEEEENTWTNQVAEKIIDGIQKLEKQTGHCIIVTNDIFREGFGTWEGTKEYLSCLGKIHVALVHQAEVVYEVVAGIPICMKRNCSLEKKGEENKDMPKSIVVLGGAYQGKKEFVKKKWKIESDEENHWDIIEHMEDWIKKDMIKYHQICLKEKKEMDQQALCEWIWRKVEENSVANRNTIYIINEIGAGIVPMEKEERLHREIVGRITCELAKKADEVYRIVAGCAIQIK